MILLSLACINKIDSIYKDVAKVFSHESRRISSDGSRRMALKLFEGEHVVVYGQGQRGALRAKVLHTHANRASRKATRTSKIIYNIIASGVTINMYTQGKTVIFCK